MNSDLIRALVVLRLSRILKDRMGLVWLLIMPMAFSFLMGQLLGDWGGGSSNLPRFMVFDLDGGAAADSLLVSLENNDRFRVVRSDTTTSETAVLDALERSRITAALFIPEGFSDPDTESNAHPLRLFYDSDRLSSQTVRTLLEKSVLKVNTLHAAQSLVWRDLQNPLPTDRSERFDSAEFEDRWDEPRISVTSSTLGRVEEDGLVLTKASQHVGPAYTIFFVMMFLMTSAKDLVTERKEGTLARLVTSRASSLDLVLGFFLGGMTVGLVQAGTLLALNSLAFGIDYGTSAGGLVLVVVLMAGVSSAGAVLLGSVARSGAQAEGLGMAVTMIMAALGGLWWPLEIVPEFMQSLGKCIPTGQAITVFHDMIGRGHGIQQMSTLFLGLGLWFLGLLILASWRLRKIVA
ncbi:MAG: ABC transporter permease [Gemmatimonadales bacterium]|nr:ABC transporter permease [Gemmatimonadales bacterium]